MIIVSLDAADLNVALPRWLSEDITVVYSAGAFKFSHRLPIGSVSGVAVGSFRGTDLVLAVPFRRISAPLLGPFARVLAKTFWGSITSRLAAVGATRLLRHGLPPDTIAVGQGRDESGETAGLITFRLDRVQTWLERATGWPIGMRVRRLTFELDMIQVAVDVITPPE